MSDVGHVGVGGLEELMVWRSTWEEFEGEVGGRSLWEEVGGRVVWFRVVVGGGCLAYVGEYLGGVVGLGRGG